MCALAAGHPYVPTAPTAKPDSAPLATALPSAADVLATSPKPLSSAALLRGAKAVAITHNGSVYRLQATRLGKLILTK
jgi:hemin uptake protein HemP